MHTEISPPTPSTAWENLRTEETFGLLNAADAVLGGWGSLDFGAATESHSLRGVVNKLQRARKQFDSKLFFVVVFGPLKAGKSTLANALAREQVSPTGFGRETTLRPSMIVQSRESGIDQYFLRDREAGNAEEGFNLVADHLRGLLTEEELKRVVVKQSSPLNPDQLEAKLTQDLGWSPLITVIRVPGGKMVGQGVAMVDMPGLDGNQTNWDKDPIHKWVIERADFFLFVQSSMAALNRDTRMFLEEVIRQSKLPPVWLIQNVIDAKHWIDDAKRQAETDRQRESALKTVMEGLRLPASKPPPITSLNLGKAWDGISLEREEWEKESGFPEFEEKITSFLLGQRAVIQERNSVKGFNKALEDCEATLSEVRGAITKTRENYRRQVEILDHCLQLVASIDYSMGQVHFASQLGDMANEKLVEWQNEMAREVDKLKKRHNKRRTGKMLNGVLESLAAQTSEIGVEIFGGKEVLKKYRAIAEEQIGLAEERWVVGVNRMLEDQGWLLLPRPGPPRREDLPVIEDTPFSIDQVEQNSWVFWHKTYEAQDVADHLDQARDCFKDDQALRGSAWGKALESNHIKTYCARRLDTFQDHLRSLKERQEALMKPDMDRAEAALALIETMQLGLRELASCSTGAMASMEVG